MKPLQWHHNERDGISNHQPHECLLKRLFARRSKLRVTGLYGGNSPVTGEFPAQRTSNTKNVSIWWRHHAMRCLMWSRDLFKNTFISTHFSQSYTSTLHMRYLPMVKRIILIPGWMLRLDMITSSNGNIFRVTGHLCGEFTGHRWIPRTKASDSELWCFLWSVPE